MRAPLHVSMSTGVLVTFRTRPPSFWSSGCYNSPTPLLQCSLSVRVRSCILDLSAGPGLPTATCPLRLTRYDIVQWSPSIAKGSFFDGEGEDRYTNH